jgi:hypothetical protein
MTDQQALLIQSYTRFGAPEQTKQDPAAKQFAGTGFEAAKSPKPSTLGRIYHESPLSSYISHVQVGCVVSPDTLPTVCLCRLHPGYLRWTARLSLCRASVGLQ